MSVLAFIILFGAVVFFHELGHFLAAKLLGVKVLRFSIGFGPRLLGFERKGTEYWLAALPLGGYVKMAGQDPTAEVAPEDVGKGFFDQPPLRRLVISLAGPLFNFLLTLLIYVGVTAGLSGSNEIGTVLPRSPAEAAGLRSGDRILTVAAPGQAARPARYFEEIRELISPHAGEPLVLEVQRDGKRLAPLTITPASAPDEDALGDPIQRGQIGVSPYYPSAQVMPIRPGGAGGLQPLDVVVKAAGRPIRNGVDLARALEAAACAPLDLEVLRPDPAAKAGAAAPRVPLPGVPTCADGAATLQLADPNLAAVVGSVDAGGPAAAAGLRRGDIIQSVDGKAIRSYSDLVRLLRNGEFEPGRPVDLRLADGRALKLVPGTQKNDGASGSSKKEPELGFAADFAGVDLQALSPRQEPLRLGAVEVASKSWDQLVDSIRWVAIGLGRLIGRRSLEGSGGPIELFHATSVIMEQSGWGGFIRFLAIVSVNVAILNLLPIPVLDGGNIGQALVEIVMRRTLSLRTRAVTNMVGLAVLLTLFGMVFWRDIVRQVRRHSAATAIQSTERDRP